MTVHWRCSLFIVSHTKGVFDVKAGPELQKLAENLGCAVATSYNGKGVIDELSPAAVGMLGTWGNQTANRVLAKFFGAQRHAVT